MVAPIEIRASCACCGEDASDQCTRCCIGLCEAHQHGDERRCPDCERDYQKSLKRRAAHAIVGPVCVASGMLSGLAVGVLAAYFLAQLGALVGLAPAFAIFGLVTFTVGGAAAGGVGARALIDGHLREQFLLERSNRRRLPAARLIVSKG